MRYKKQIQRSLKLYFHNYNNSKCIIKTNLITLSLNLTKRFRNTVKDIIKSQNLRSIFQA